MTTLLQKFYKIAVCNTFKYFDKMPLLSLCNFKDFLQKLFPYRHIAKIELISNSQTMTILSSDWKIIGMTLYVTLIDLLRYKYLTHGLKNLHIAKCYRQSFTISPRCDHWDFWLKMGYSVICSVGNFLIFIYQKAVKISVPFPYYASM